MTTSTPEPVAWRPEVNDAGRATPASLRELTVRAWAQALFRSSLGPTNRPDSRTVLQAVVEQFVAAPADCGCGSNVARQADNPTGVSQRMAWCRVQADLAYTTLLSSCLPHQAHPAAGPAVPEPR